MVNGTKPGIILPFDFSEILKLINWLATQLEISKNTETFSKIISAFFWLLLVGKPKTRKARLDCWIMATTSV